MQTPTQPLTAMRNITDPALANVTVPLAKPGLLHRLVDPDAGDTLLVVTAPPPVRGFIKRQDFVEMSLLESIHGVAVRPNSDDVTAEIASDKIILGRPGGLTLSSATCGAERAPTAARPIFDVDEWHKNQEGRLHRAAGRADRRAAARRGRPAHAGADRSGAVLSGARDVSGSQGACSISCWPTPSRAREDPVALIVHSVASILMGRPEQGLKDLANPAIGNNYDSQLWKALAYARQGKWAEAREKFKNVEFAITSLPIDLQRIVITDAMRASLEVKDYSGAAKRSSDLGSHRRSAGDEARDRGVARPARRSARPRQGCAGRIQDRGRFAGPAGGGRSQAAARSRCGRSATRSARPTRCASWKRCR